jgi:filamentous hemagglutinin
LTEAQQLRLLGDAVVKEADGTLRLVGSSLPEYKLKIYEGIAFNAERKAAYEFSEIAIGNSGSKSGKVFLDSYGSGEIVSRKYTQFDNILEDTALRYLTELANKYPPGAIIADTPRMRQLGLAGKDLNGVMILEVPSQTRGAIPQGIIDAADRLFILIRDTAGQKYNKGRP